MVKRNAKTVLPGDTFDAKWSGYNLQLNSNPTPNGVRRLFLTEDANFLSLPVASLVIMGAVGFFVLAAVTMTILAFSSPRKTQEPFRDSQYATTGSAITEV